MARGMVGIKGGTTSVKPKNVPKSPEWVLGSRPAVLRSEPLSRPQIKPQAPSQRDYGKPAFSTLGQGNTGMSGMS